MIKCTKCRWWKNCNGINCLPFWGNPNAELVLVGEAFGSSEANNYLKTGEPKPFIGKAGDNLETLLKWAKLERGDIAIMNAIRCHNKGNPSPTRGDLDACMAYTFFDLQRIKPKLVVALGTSAFYQLTGKTELQPNLGKVLWSDKVKCKIYATYHPAACIYDPEKWKLLKKHFKNLREAIDKEPDEIKHYEYKYIETSEQFDLIFNNFENEEYLYFDVEAEGLDPYENNLTCVQIAYNSEIIYVIDANILNEIEDKLRFLFETKKIVGQGWEFDAKYLSVKHNIFPRHWHFDTCLAEYTLTGMKDNDLTYLTYKYVPESYGYDDDIKKAGGAHKIKDVRKLRQYAADDVGVLPIIKKKQEKDLMIGNYEYLYNNIIMPSNKVLTKMSLRGVKYDLDLLRETDSKYEKKAKRLLLKVQTMDSIKNCEKHFKRTFNPNSSQMIKWLLIDYYKLPVLKTTDGKDNGNPSVGKDEMKKYAEDHNNEYCKIMEKYRSIQTIKSNFLGGVIPKLKNGIAHTRYSLHSTATGRPNSIDPNLLNVPRNKDIKRCIVPREGYKFVAGDEAQVEVRIASVIYDEPILIDICNDIHKDMHCNITSKAFKRDYDEIYDGYKNGDEEITELRVAGKSITFGIIYQMGAAKLAYQLGIEVEKAQQFIDDFYGEFFNLKKNINTTIEELIKNGFLRNYFGFVRRWKYHSEDDHKSQREGVNFLVQGLAWNLLQLAMIEVDKRFEEENLDAHLVLQVYDSLVAEVREDHVDPATEILKEVLENVNKPFKDINRVLLKTDIEIGDSLAEV